MNTINPTGAQNIGQTERMLSLAGGALLSLTALRRAPWTLILLAVGAALIYRGVSGNSTLYRALGLSSFAPPQTALAPSEDQVDATVEESFPASDPPGWHTGSSFTQVSE